MHPKLCSSSSRIFEIFSIIKQQKNILIYWEVSLRVISFLILCIGVNLYILVDRMDTVLYFFFHCVYRGVFTYKPKVLYNKMDWHWSLFDERWTILLLRGKVSPIDSFPWWCVGSFSFRYKFNILHHRLFQSTEWLWKILTLHFQQKIIKKSFVTLRMLHL